MYFKESFGAPAFISCKYLCAYSNVNQVLTYIFKTALMELSICQVDDRFTPNNFTV